MNHAEIDHLAIAKTQAAAKRKSYEALRKEEKKAEIEKAYAEFLAEPDAQCEEFFGVVTKFIQKKIQSLHWDNDCADRTVDDIVACTMMELYQTMLNVQVRDFYAYLNRICYRVGYRTVCENREFNSKFLPLIVDSEDEDGCEEQILNPEIFKQTGSVSTQGTFELKRPLKRRRTFPKWIVKGSTDDQIVNYLRCGKKYKEISRLLGLTLSGVNHRIERMRIRAVADNEAHDLREFVATAADRARKEASTLSRRTATAAKIDKLTAYRKL